MNRHSLAFAIALAAGASLLAADRDPHVLMISIDGLMASSYAAVSPSKIPAIRRLMSEGAYADGVIGVLPTVTYPSHTTLVTGVPPAVHGIVDNTMFDPEKKSGGASYWYARDIQVPTQLGAVHGRGWRTGAVSWPVTVGQEIDYHVPEFGNFDPSAKTFVFTCYSICETTEIATEVFDRLLKISGLYKVVHIEPIGWQTPRLDGEDRTIMDETERWAKETNANTNLVSILKRS